MSDGFGYHELARAALGFILDEDECWPVFLAWAETQHQSQASHDWLATADLAKSREWWLAHSPDPEIRGLVPDGV
jgi:hypothetical protein